MTEELLKNSAEIVNLVRERWIKGRRPDGSIIGTYRSFAYEQEKRAKNPLAGGNVDLIDTGRLEKGLRVAHVNGSIYNIFSTDDKAVPIAEKYGLDVYGLTPEEEEMVLNEAANRVFIELYEFVGL